MKHPMKTHNKEQIAERQAKLDAIVGKGIQDVINDIRERLEIAEDKIEQLEIRSEKRKWIGNTICEVTAMEPRNQGRY